MRFGSLFSGIGGIDLGLERAGMECAWQVENEPYCLKVLAKHWPNVTRYEDIREVDFERVEPVELLAGGFPCQDLSYAGKGAGLSGKRSGLWGEFVRAIRMVRPRYVLVENVPGLLGRGMGVVLGDLCALGYDAEWESIPAAAFGAPHLRWRVFIVAYASHGRGWNEISRGCPKRDQEASVTGLRTDVAYTEQRELQRLGRPGELVEAAGRIESERHQRQRSGYAARGRSETVAHPEQVGRRGLPDAAGRNNAHGKETGWEEGAGGPEQCGEDVPDAAGIGWREGRAESIRRRQAVFSESSGPRRTESWEAEPEIRRVVDGFSGRVDQLRGLGNAVVPQKAEWLGRLILEHEGA